MPVTALRTRLNIRQNIGMSLAAIDQSGGSNTLQVTATSSADGWTVGALTFGASNEHRGKWVFAVAGSSNASSNVGLTRRVSTFTSSNTRLSFVTNWAAAADTSQTFELWDEWASPVLIHNYMNQAITEATKKGAVAVRPLFHTAAGQRTYGMPSGSSVIGIQEIEFRSRWTGEQITSLDNAMSSGTSVTVETDSSNKKEGAAAAKLNLASGVSSAATVATSSFGTVDARGYTHIEFWAMSNITTTSSSLQARLGEGSTARETVAIPAMTADSWTYHRIALGNPELDSAITRFVLMTGASDAGSMTVWLDDVSLTRDGTEDWTRLNRRFWGIDQANTSVVFEDDATVPYALVRVTARRAPNLLTADSDVCEVDPDYVTYSALAKMLRSRGDVSGRDPDAAMKQAENYEQKAQSFFLRMGTPQGVRWLENSS